MNTEFQFGKTKNILEMDSADRKELLNDTQYKLKNVEMAKFSYVHWLE